MEGEVGVPSVITDRVSVMNGVKGEGSIAGVL
jgi:hypothetical protein